MEDSNETEGMLILEQNNTWYLVQLLFGKYVVGCRWVHRKSDPNGSIACLKARLRKG